MRKLLITLAVLAVILVGLDIGGRIFAENELASELGKQAELPTEPSLDIGGFSFLWQVVDGNYEHLALTLPNVTVGEFDDVAADVDAYGVALTIGDVVGGSIDSVTAEKVTVRAAVPFTSLAKAFDTPQITLSAGDSSTLLVKSTLATGGRTFDITAQVSPTIRKNVLYLKADKVVDSSGIPAALASRFLSGLTVQYPLEGLPVTIDAGQATVIGDSLVLSASSLDVPIGSLLQ